MKLHWIKLSIILIATVILTGCASTPANSGEKEIWTTFPSQFIVGDTYILKSHEKIDGNIVGIGTTLIIKDNALVMGDVSLIGSNLEVDGRIAGDLNIMAGSALINDPAIITGDINQFFQTIEIKPKALVTGEINTYSFPAAASGQAGTRVTQLIEWLKPGKIAALFGARILGLVLFSLIGIYLFKTPTIKVTEAVGSNLPAAWGAGLLSIIAVPIVAIILIISICLSPLGILLLLASIIASIWGWVALSSIFGKNLVKWLKLDWAVEPSTVFGALLLGIASSLLSFIPCVGFLILLFLTATGIGGVLLSRFGLVPG